jgi:3-deoxy-D-manno-octulosonic-acid transferase
MLKELLTPRNKYYALTSALATPIKWWLYFRMFKGKEDKERISERFGVASKKRKPGQLIWFHASSVGEANSVLLLINRIRGSFPDYNVLLTTGTVTSAKLMQARLPKEVIHQYAPIDTPEAVDKFLRHWKPDIAFWVESELWPNMVYMTRDTGCFMVLINARMSRKSYHSWKRHAVMIKELINCFDYMFAQSEVDAVRLQGLGKREVLCNGNLKYDAALLTCNENELIALKTAIGGRPVWLASCTHPGEEEMIAKVHSILMLRKPNLLTIIVPRHPDRGEQVAEMLKKKYQVALRSKKQPIAPYIQFYVADTIGELGLFYRLCEVVFMGGSLVEHGGQNPLEPARLSCAIVTGPHTDNFKEIYEDMVAVGAALRATSADNLTAHVDNMLNNSTTRTDLQDLSKRWVELNSGAITKIMEVLDPIFIPPKKKEAKSA